MNKTFEAFIRDLSTLRTGRAHASMLDIIKVDVYGQKIPINQLGTINAPEPRTLNIQVWDQNNVTLIDSSIRKSELGLNPQIDGQLIRISIPNLNEERRNELKKMIKTMAEKSKVSIRNIRREANDELKKLLRNVSLFTLWFTATFISIKCSKGYMKLTILSLNGILLQIISLFKLN